jgi:hypothetical protein
LFSSVVLLVVLWLISFFAALMVVISLVFRLVLGLVFRLVLGLVLGLVFELLVGSCLLQLVGGSVSVLFAATVVHLLSHLALVVVVVVVVSPARIVGVVVFEELGIHLTSLPSIL